MKSFAFQTVSRIGHTTAAEHTEPDVRMANIAGEFPAGSGVGSSLPAGGFVRLACIRIWVL